MVLFDLTINNKSSQWCWSANAVALGNTWYRCLKVQIGVAACHCVAHAPFIWWRLRFAPARCRFLPAKEKNHYHWRHIGKIDHPVQKAWIEYQVPQCGYCQSGQIMSTVAIAQAKSKTNRRTNWCSNAGHLCRCGHVSNEFALLFIAPQNLWTMVRIISNNFLNWCYAPNINDQSAAIF